MSAAELRKAAETLRVLANRAGGNPWSRTDPEPSDCGERCCPSGEVFDANGHAVIDAWQVAPKDADFIATMHPGVGLALADLLDSLAYDYEQADVDGRTWDHNCVPLARLINGGV